MAHRSRFPLVVLLLTALVIVAGAGVAWWGFTQLRVPAVRFVLRGSSGSSGRLKVSGGNLVVVAPKPGVFFGTVKKPESAEQFTYVILFRYGRPKSDGASRDVQFNCRSDARSAETTDAIELDGRRIEAAYRVALDEALTGVTAESLTVGGKRVDTAGGRVFLIDLAADAPAYRQKSAELPAIPANLETPADIERLADTIRQTLESQDPEFRAFLH